MQNASIIFGVLAVKNQLKSHKRPMTNDNIFTIYNSLSKIHARKNKLIRNNKHHTSVFSSPIKIPNSSLDNFIIKNDEIDYTKSIKKNMFKSQKPPRLCSDCKRRVDRHTDAEINGCKENIKRKNKKMIQTSLINQPSKILAGGLH